MRKVTAGSKFVNAQATVGVECFSPTKYVIWFNVILHQCQHTIYTFKIGVQYITSFGSDETEVLIIRLDKI